MDYREQKIAEAKVMVEEGKPEEAKQVLDRALQYGDIVEREVSPGIKDKVTESSKRVEGAINKMKETKHIKGLGTATADLKEISKHKCQNCGHKAVKILRCKYLCKRCG